MAPTTTSTSRPEGLLLKALAFVYYALGAYVGLITALISCYIVLVHDAWTLAWDVFKHPGSYVPWPKEEFKRKTPAMTPATTPATKPVTGSHFVSSTAPNPVPKTSNGTATGPIPDIRRPVAAPVRS